MEISNGLYEAVLHGDATAALAFTEEALRAGTNPLELVHSSMMPAMTAAGRLFEAEEYFVPELLLSARAMKAAMERIRPLLAQQGSEPAGRVVIGTVRGDLHDIGKNLVASMFEGGGFEVIDLGVNVTPESFLKAAKERRADVVALSALLTTTMPSMKETIDLFDSEQLRPAIRIMIGGAPVTQRFAEEAGADGYSENAVGAVELAQRWIDTGGE